MYTGVNVHQCNGCIQIASNGRSCLRSDLRPAQPDLRPAQRDLRPAQPDLRPAQAFRKTFTRSARRSAPSCGTCLGSPWGTPVFGKRSLGVHAGARLPMAPASGAPGEHRFSENVHSECTFLRKDTDPVCVDLLEDNLGLEFPKSPHKRGFPDRKMRSGVFTPKSYTFWCESHLQCVTLAVNVAHKSKRRARLPLFGSHLRSVHTSDVW